MLARDTSYETEAIVNQLYQQMSPGEKLLRTFSAYKTGQALALTGLAIRYPESPEEQLQWLWKRQHLGEVLFKEVYGQKIANELPK
jgi:hypothetical protein